MGSELIAGFVVMGLKWLIRESPTTYSKITTLINKPNPTDADFDAAKAEVAGDTYGKLVPNSQLPA